MLELCRDWAGSPSADWIAVQAGRAGDREHTQSLHVELYAVKIQSGEQHVNLREPGLVFC